MWQRFQFFDVMQHDQWITLLNSPLLQLSRAVELPAFVVLYQEALARLAVDVGEDLNASSRYGDHWDPRVREEAPGQEYIEQVRLADARVPLDGNGSKPPHRLV